MSTVKSKNVQVGTDTTPSNNFTWYQPVTPDGTVRLGRGDSGSVTEVARLNGSGDVFLNAGFGSVAQAYMCRAWVNFNGTGTVAIRGSGNVTSITDNGVGDYTVNFTSAMADANYAATFGVKSAIGTGTTQVEIPTSGGDPTTAALRINTVYVSGSPANNRTAIDAPIVNVSVFR